MVEEKDDNIIYPYIKCKIIKDYLLSSLFFLSNLFAFILIRTLNDKYKSDA